MTGLQPNNKHVIILRPNSADEGPDKTQTHTHTHMHTHTHTHKTPKPALTSAAGTPVADLHVRAGLIGGNVTASDALQARQITHHS